MILTPEFLKDKFYIHTNVPNAMVTPSIKYAEELVLEPAIGSELYKRLLNTSTHTLDYTKLITEYVLDVIVMATMADLMLNGTYQMYTKGVTKKSDQFSTEVEYAEIEKLADSYRYKCDAYKGRLIDFLNLNNSKFIEYKNGLKTYSCSVYLHKQNECGC